MEFLAVIFLITASSLAIWKPQKVRLAQSFLWLGFLMVLIIFLLMAHPQLLPSGNF